MDRYIARFTPEAWINDNAVPVDPEGPATWDCTRAVTEDLEYWTRMAAGGDWEDVLDNDDTLADDPDAPEWVRTWQGPRSIHVSRKAATMNYEEVLEVVLDTLPGESREGYAGGTYIVRTYLPDGRNVIISDGDSDGEPFSGLEPAEMLYLGLYASTEVADDGGDPITTMPKVPANRVDLKKALLAITGLGAQGGDWDSLSEEDLPGLDELVHDQASQLASNIVNAGSDDMRDYLLANGWTLTEIIERLRPATEHPDTDPAAPVVLATDDPAYDEAAQQEAEGSEATYHVKFEVVVTATNVEEAESEARFMLRDDRFEPVSIEVLDTSAPTGEPAGPPTEVTETFPCVDSIPLRLSFTPKAIREHYEDGDGEELVGLTDELLAKVGSYALSADDLYRTFHEVLDEAVKAVREEAGVTGLVVE